MVFGHNTNIKMGAVTFHVQTEDRGEYHGLIDTTVYFQGRVLHRRTNNYFDLLPGEPATVTLKSAATIDQLKSTLKIMSLTEAYAAN